MYEAQLTKKSLQSSIVGANSLVVSAPTYSATVLAATRVWFPSRGPLPIPLPSLHQLSTWPTWTCCEICLKKMFPLHKFIFKCTFNHSHSTSNAYYFTSMQNTKWDFRTLEIPRSSFCHFSNNKKCKMIYNGLKHPKWWISDWWQKVWEPWPLWMAKVCPRGHMTDR